MKKRLLIVFALFFCLLADANEAADSLHRWGGEVSVSPGTTFAMDHYVRKWLKNKQNFMVAAELHYSSLPQDSDSFAADFGYPVISFGMNYCFNRGVTMHREQDPSWGLLEPVDYTSRLGNVLTAYGSFARPFFRNRKWETSYTFSFGLGYSKDKYNVQNNIDNELIGSRWLIYFAAGLHATCRIAENWGLKGGLDFYHHSNGALNRPNKGSNFVAPSLALVYYPYYRESLNRGRFLAKSFSKYVYLNFVLGVGAKTLDEDWQKTQFYTPPGHPDYRTDHFRLYAAYSLQTDAMYRYARRWASGIGLDIFHGTYSSHIQEMDTGKNYAGRHSPWSIGIAAKHEVFYHNLSLGVSLGFYLFREMGKMAKEMEKPYYERIGIHYTFPSFHNLTLGINVKAHKTKADFTELVIGIPVKL
ncbi:MAG: acyloxyacyl hydrolase [Prevotellaceae bacterium]|nr:acyloxyacyl hydrolase [Prevotella sp.]MDD7257490.1 acyloxyacyl hydrolase [Prevotellaceae bacterium]MDY6131629.1 acyloxyacyl hydrolase [Prevotella sp.]